VDEGAAVRRQPTGPGAGGHSAGGQGAGGRSTAGQSTGGQSAGDVLALLRHGRASTRAELGALTGLSRTAVNARLADLAGLGLVVERDRGPSTGGRPPGRLELAARGGVVLAASMGFTRTQVAVADLTAGVLAATGVDLDLAAGPDPVLDRVGDLLAGLLEQLGCSSADVLGVGVALPGPVESGTGRLVRPPGLPGWADAPVAPPLRRRWPVPVLVDNDVNAMAVGEHWASRGGIGDLLLVKVSTGIGAGLVLGGRPHRGARGAAGDLGHNPVADGTGVLCRCGNEGCVEAVASGSALVRQLQDRGRDVATVADVVALVDAGDPEAHGLVRLAGRRLGDVLAAAVNLLNPAAVVLAGDLAAAQEPLFAGVRDVLLPRATTLAGRDLQVLPSALGEQAGLVGCAVSVLDEVLSPAAVDARLARA